MVKPICQKKIWKNRSEFITKSRRIQTNGRSGFADKMMQAFKENAKLTQKEVTFDEFVKLMEDKQKAAEA